MKAPQFLAFAWRRFGPDGGQDSQELPCGDHLGKNKRPVLDRPLYITWVDDGGRPPGNQRAGIGGQPGVTEVIRGHSPGNLIGVE